MVVFPTQGNPIQEPRISFVDWITNQGPLRLFVVFLPVSYFPMLTK
jgi:hypothetical protein